RPPRPPGRAATSTRRARRLALLCAVRSGVRGASDRWQIASGKWQRSMRPVMIDAQYPPFCHLLLATQRRCEEGGGIGEVKESDVEQLELGGSAVIAGAEPEQDVVARRQCLQERHDAGQHAVGAARQLGGKLLEVEQTETCELGREIPVVERVADVALAQDRV